MDLLETEYGGIKLRSPVIVGACPLTAEEMIQIPIVSSGAGAIVLPSLFEEQVEQWNEQNGYLSTVTPQHVRNLQRRATRVNEESVCDSAEAYLKLVERSRSQMPIPVIASLNGVCVGNWSDFASELQAAGASGIELNVQHPDDDDVEPREIEDEIVRCASQVNDVISIPLFLKLSRNYTNIAHLICQLQSVAQGIVLFGKSPQTDICLDRLAVTSSWGLTNAGSTPSSIETIMQVRKSCPEMSLAASGGIGDSTDVIKVLLAGADVAMVTSAIYRGGPTVIGSMLEGLIHFMECRHITSIKELKAKVSLSMDSDQTRLDQVHALSSQRNPGELSNSVHTPEGDRWGHPRSAK